MKPSTKYKAVLQYIGTRYAGWQIQKDRKTVQGCLKEALGILSGEDVTVIGAGRTDAGVHALGQVAHFRIQKEFALGRLHRALNSLLPWDIRVIRLKVTRPNFHAQKHALKKRYEYRIYNGLILSPFLYGYVHHTPAPLNSTAMKEAASLLCGRRDFSGFAAAGTQTGNRNRHVFVSRLRRRGHLILYQIEADGFLHHMVRNIVGTLLQVALGQRPSEDIVSIFKSQDRRNAGPTASAHGLYLMKVFY